MKVDILDGTTIDLAGSQVLRLHGAGGTTISCEAGVLWVTQEGLVRDDFLCAGQSLRVESAGATVIEAVGELAARVRLRAGQAPARAWAIPLRQVSS